MSASYVVVDEAHFGTSGLQLFCSLDNKNDAALSGITVERKATDGFMDIVPITSD